MTGIARFIAWPVAVLGLAYFAYIGRMPNDPADGMHWVALGDLPVQDGGRIKPLDTYARLTLRIISGRQDVIDDKGKVQATAIQWLTEVWSSTNAFRGPAAKRKVFRIENDQLLEDLKLKPRPGFYRYSPEELEPMVDLIEVKRQAAQREKAAGREIDLIQNKIIDLGDHLSLYQKTVHRFAPAPLPPANPSSKDWLTLTDAIEPVLTQEFGRIAEFIRQRNISVQDLKPSDMAFIRAEAEDRAFESLLKNAPNSDAGAFLRIIDRAKAQDAPGFNEAVKTFRDDHYPQLSESEGKFVWFEHLYNHAEPFYHCAVLYGFVLVMAAVSWLGPQDWLRRPAIGLGVAIFVVHTAALIARMAIHGRPPVTNLYSTAIFVGWGSVGLLLLLERWYSNGIPTFLAGAIGLTTLIVAHFLSLSSDTLEMLQAVLDTNFWLATHVTSVNLGYTATLVAGLVGAAYIIRGVCTPTLTPQANRSMADMMYGVVCFAMLLSFVGTVLGGIWGDQSWGRFWGWDAKENGAVLIVVWNALILHARWAGMVKARGIAVLAVFGNIVTVWSWFGTNQLGVGLHNYGFNNEVAKWVVIVDVVMLAIIGMGLIPQRKWWSTTANAAAPAKKSAEPPAGRPVASR